jgi:hypothetical protein
MGKDFNRFIPLVSNFPEKEEEIKSEKQYKEDNDLSKFEKKLNDLFSEWSLNMSHLIKTNSSESVQKPIEIILSNPNPSNSYPLYSYSPPPSFPANDSTLQNFLPKSTFLDNSFNSSILQTLILVGIILICLLIFYVIFLFIYKIMKYKKD